MKKKIKNKTYTQREWDRTVGWGKVPKKYRTKILKANDSWIQGYKKWKKETKK